MSVAAPAASPFLAGNFAPVSDELAVEDLPIEGRLPPGLRGTLYRNGPNPQHPVISNISGVVEVKSGVKLAGDALDLRIDTVRAGI